MNDDTTLITLPPWGFGSDVFDSLREALPEARFHSLDLAGFGSRQEDAPIDWSVTWAAGDVRDRLEEIRGTRLVLVGASSGGMVALACAAARPERLAAVISIGGSARFIQGADYPLGAPREVVDQVLAAARTDLVEATREYLPVWFNEESAEAAARGGALALAAVRSIRSPDQATEILAAIYRADIRPSLPDVRVPVLLIHGENDPVSSPDHGRFVHEHLDDATLETIPGTAHFPFITAPERTADVIRSFLRRIDGEVWHGP